MLRDRKVHIFNKEYKEYSGSCRQRPDKIGYIHAMNQLDRLKKRRKHRWAMGFHKSRWFKNSKHFHTTLKWVYGWTIWRHRNRHPSTF